MLIAVRHGSTSMNGEQGERTRGWLSIPLTLDGMKEASKLADSLQSLKDVDHLYSSDIVRAIQSGHEISMALHKELEPTHMLRDWNVGDYSGQEVTKILPKLHYHIDHPNIPVPNGESYQSFLDRTAPFLKKLVESDDFNMAVTHNRVTTLLKALAMNKGQYPDIGALKSKGPIENAQFMAIDPDWNIIHPKT